MEVLTAMRTSEADELREQFDAAVKLTIRTLALYSVQELALSFNAGKDSCVLLHVLRAALAESQPQNGYERGSLCGVRCFMFRQEDEFPEIHHFSLEMNEKYGLNLVYLDCPMAENLKSFAEAHGLKAVILGTRRGDPDAAGQSFFSPTTGDWPPLMRVNPILDWSYQHVWGFIRRANIPYCSLYDAGYTSIGGVHNTRPNSSLRKENGTYAPAFLLSDGRLERIGRRSSALLNDECCTLTKKAALLIIGDELLSGKVADTNVAFLCRELRSLGWRVNKIVFVGDDVDGIAEEVHSLSTSHEMVLTAGGIGPTADDVTMAGVAAAMQTSLFRHPYLVQLCREFFQEDVTEAHLKMTEVPRDEIEFLDEVQKDGEPSPFPLVKCRNVYMFPGVPEYLRLRWKVLKQKLGDEEALPPFHNVVLRLKSGDETEIAPALDAVMKEMGPEVQVKDQSDGTTVLVCLESKVEQHVADAQKVFSELLPPGLVAGSGSGDGEVLCRGGDFEGKACEDLVKGSFESNRYLVPRDKGIKHLHIWRSLVDLDSKGAMELAAVLERAVLR